MNSGRESQRHFVWLDVLRGLAALGVALYHVRVDLWIGWHAARSPDAPAWDRLAAWLAVPTPFLGIGVQLFFVVSGFCIHCAHPLGSKVAWSAYGVRRFLRLYPPYLVVVIGCLVFDRLLTAGTEGTSFGLGLSSVLMLQNATHGVQLAANPSLWSLPVELELYLAYPLARVLFARLGEGRFLLLVGCIGAVSQFFLASGHPWVALHAPHHWFGWCLGMVLAERVASGSPLLPRRPVMIAALALLPVGLACEVSSTAWLPVWLPHQLALGAGCAAVVAVGMQGGEKLAQVPAFVIRPLAWVGVLSYSLYLVHFPAFKLMGLAWQEVFGAKPGNFLVPLAATLAVIPLAWFLHRWVERPSHDLARRLARRGNSGNPA